MAPHEILASESQERMLAIVTPENLGEVLALADKWGVLATAIGEVTEGDRLVISWHGQTVVDVPPASLADEGPVYHRPYERPADLSIRQADPASVLPRPATGAELRSTLLKLLASPNLADKTWIVEQYDSYVQGNSVLFQPEDAGMIRLDEESNLGVAIATDANGRYCAMDPYVGAQLAYAEAYRNVTVTGARPIAVSDCLNFGSPEDPAVMWQFSEAVRGIADACQQLGTPVTGGNVSFYNQTGQTAIHPTPVVGVLGLMDDVTKRTRMGFTADGDRLVLLGTTREELDCSEWAWVVHQHLGGRPPAVDLAAEQALGEVLIAVSDRGLATSAHDLSEGGLAIALVESALRHGAGARVDVPAGVSPFGWLLSESAHRALLSVAPEQLDALRTLAATHGVPYAEIGTVEADSGELVIEHVFHVSLDELATAHRGTLPKLFG